MAKGFSIPGGFSLPKVSMPKVNLPKADIPDVKLTELPGIGEVAKDLESSGISLPTTGELKDMGVKAAQDKINDLKNFKMPTGAELKEMGKAKIDEVQGQISDIKDTIKNVKSEGASALIPQDLKDAGIGIDDIKGIVKGGFGK